MNALVERAKLERWQRSIARARAVDLEYYSALTGQAFGSGRRAVTHFLANEADPALGLSLSPLIERDWMAERLPERTESWYALIEEKGLLVSTCPQFDPERWARETGRAFATTAQALRDFVQTARASTVMPTASGAVGVPVTWQDFRAAAIERARVFQRQLHQRRPRTAENWDVEAETAWIAQLAPLPAGEHPEVAVIMPVRDRESSVATAIDSVRVQSYPRWRLIVVDDGSSDGTSAVVAEAAAEDSRITVLRSEGIGVSAARNLALATGVAAAAPYTAFLDSDNSWRPGFLEHSVRAILAQGARVVHSAACLERDEGVLRFRGIAGDRDDLLGAGNYLDLNSAVVETALLREIGGFDTALKRWVDYDLFLSLSALAEFAYLPFVGVDYDDRTSQARITGSESAGWEDVVLAKHRLDWVELADEASGRDAGLVSVLIPTYGDWRMTADAVRAVLANSGNARVEVVVVDNASRRNVSAILGALFQGSPEVVIARQARNLNFALGTDQAFALSRGATVVLLNNDTDVREGWLAPLLHELADPSVRGVQPLLLYPDGAVQTAGTVFPSSEEWPQHFLVGASPEEARAAGETRFDAVTAAALALRATEFAQLRGLDPSYTNGLEDVDYCLRAVRRFGGSFAVALDAVVEHKESRTQGRARAVTRNRTLFMSRWGGRLPRGDDERWERGIRTRGASEEAPK